MRAGGQRAVPRIAAIGSTPLPREANQLIAIADAEVPSPETMSQFRSSSQNLTPVGANVTGHAGVLASRGSEFGSPANHAAKGP